MDHKSKNRTYDDADYKNKKKKKHKGRIKISQGIGKCPNINEHSEKHCSIVERREISGKMQYYNQIIN